MHHVGRRGLTGRDDNVDVGLALGAATGLARHSHALLEGRSASHLGLATYAATHTTKRLLGSLNHLRRQLGHAHSAAAHVWCHLRELHSGSHWGHRHVVTAEAASVELAGATAPLHGGLLVLVVAHAAHQKSRENAAHESAAVHLLGHTALLVVAGLAAMRLGRIGLLGLNFLLTCERRGDLAAVLARLRLTAVLAVAHERFGLFGAHGGLGIQVRRAAGRHGRVLRHLDGIWRGLPITRFNAATGFGVNRAAVFALGAATLLHAADVLDAGALLVGRLDVAIGLRLGVLSRLRLLALDLAAGLAGLAAKVNRGGCAHNLTALFERAARDRAHARLRFGVKGLAGRPVGAVDLLVLFARHLAGLALHRLARLFCHFIHAFTPRSFRASPVLPEQIAWTASNFLQY